jgi:Lrp/AsnC family transcriptional regulator for asnA, asnC and gidA
MARLVNETDRKIIRLLQQNARSSYAELSRATGIPESTVRRRMDRLQQRGVIEFAMIADPSKLGYELRAMIGLRVDLRKLDDIAARLREMNEVTFAAFLTGNFDLMLHVVVPSQEDLYEFLVEKLSPIEGVRSTETFVMPWIIKPMTSWVLPEQMGTEETELGGDEGEQWNDAGSDELGDEGRDRKPTVAGLTDLAAEVVARQRARAATNKPDPSPIVREQDDPRED